VHICHGQPKGRNVNIVSSIDVQDGGTKDIIILVAVVVVANISATSDAANLINVIGSLGSMQLSV
jgi:hypothetical protein